MACATCPHTQMAAEIQSSYSSWNPFQSSPQKKVQISSSRWFLLQTHLNSSAVSSDLNSHDNYVRLPKQRTGQRPEEIYQLHVLNMSSHLNVLLWMTSQVYHKLLQHLKLKRAAVLSFSRKMTNGPSATEKSVPQLQTSSINHLPGQEHTKCEWKIVQTSWNTFLTMRNLRNWTMHGNHSHKRSVSPNVCKALRNLT